MTAGAPERVDAIVVGARAAGSKAPRVQMFSLYDPPEFEAAKAADLQLYRAGQPNALDHP